LPLTFRHGFQGRQPITGWIMISSGEGTQRTARRVGSRESGAAAPVLAIQYTLSPTDPQPRIAAVTETNNQFQVALHRPFEPTAMKSRSAIHSPPVRGPLSPTFVRPPAIFQRSQPIQAIAPNASIGSSFRGGHPEA
jgi:hypothetical protein